MHHHIYIIDQHPVQVMITFMMVGVLLTGTIYPCLYILCDSPHLRLVTRLTDDKKISHRFIDLPEVQRDDILPFLLLYSGNNGFDDFRILR